MDNRGEVPKPEQPRKLEDRYYATALTPVEHAIMSSGIPSPSGENMGPEEIYQQDKNFSLRPLGGDTQKIREQRRNKYIQGYFSPFEPDFDLLIGRYEQRLFLPDVDESGKITPQFTLEMVRKDISGKRSNSIPNAVEISSRLRLHAEASERFHLDLERNDQGESTGRLILSLK